MDIKGLTDSEGKSMLTVDDWIEAIVKDVRTFGELLKESIAKRYKQPMQALAVRRLEDKVRFDADLRQLFL